MAEQTKKRSMTTDTTPKICENPKKKEQIQRSDEGKQSKKESDHQRGHCLDLWEVWSRNLSAKRRKLFKITTSKLLSEMKACVSHHIVSATHKKHAFQCNYSATVQ